MILTKEMCKARKATVKHGPGEAWFYVCPNGIELYVSDQKGAQSKQGVYLSTRQLERALQIIGDRKAKAK